MSEEDDDVVSLHDLTLRAAIGADWWGRARPQPVLVSVHAHTGLARAGASDDVAHSLHYGHLAAAVRALEATPFADLAALAEAAAAAARGPAFAGVRGVRVVAEAPKLLLRAGGLGVAIARPAGADAPDTIYIKDLAIPVVIGVNAPERLQRQLVLTTVVFLRPPPAFPHASVAERLAEHIEGTAFLTLEAFATSVARVACAMEGMDTVTVRAQKPSAVSFGRSSGVAITRSRAFFAAGG